METKGKKFICIYFKEPLKEANKHMLDDFFKGLLGANISPIQKDSTLTIVFDSDLDVSFQEVIEGMNSEFYVSARLFESGTIFDNSLLEDYIHYVETLGTCFFKASTLYYSESHLVNHNLSNEIVRKNILKQYASDYEMLEVIKAYLDNNMNISKAATSLYMHRNTVMNKIDRFIAVTGYDIKQFKNAFTIYHLLQ